MRVKQCFVSVVIAFLAFLQTASAQVAFGEVLLGQPYWAAAADKIHLTGALDDEYFRANPVASGQPYAFLLNNTEALEAFFYQLISDVIFNPPQAAKKLLLPETRMLFIGMSDTRSKNTDLGKIGQNLLDLTGYDPQRDQRDAQTVFLKDVKISELVGGTVFLYVYLDKAIQRLAHVNFRPAHPHEAVAKLYLYLQAVFAHEVYGNADFFLRQDHDGLIEMGTLRESDTRAWAQHQAKREVKAYQTGIDFIRKARHVDRLEDVLTSLQEIIQTIPCQDCALSTETLCAIYAAVEAEERVQLEGWKNRQ